ncbi:hypothetical protein [uncultured Duncaniella sp.]|nr:hypothetical protein [uncultured Duncaniella sp.]
MVACVSGVLRSALHFGESPFEKSIAGLKFSDFSRLRLWVN